MASAPGPGHPRLEGDVEADVVVVGGGIAGLCTAWELGRAGRRVVLVEARRIAGGVTGHTTGKLSALHGLRYARLVREQGLERARWYARSQGEAIGLVTANAAASGVDCEVERLPAYLWTEHPEALPDLRAEVEAALAVGLDAEYLGAERSGETGLPFPVVGAVRVADQAQFHPRRYLLALAADLVRHGGEVYERTRITGLHEGSPCRVTAADGATVTAREVVVATHYPVFDRALMFARLRPVRELVVAGPVPAEAAPPGLYLSPDLRTRSVRSAPYDGGRRLLIVTGEKFTPGSGGVARRHERLAAWARERFPDLGPEPRYRWAAQDNSTTDGVPYVGRFHPGARHVYVATGFDGWGMTGGVMAGRLLCELITGREPPWAALYDPLRLHPRQELPALLRGQSEVVRHLVGDWADALATEPPGSGLAPGEGTVTRHRGRRVALSRDRDGRTRAVSASCTHLGCTVRFNDAELSWDCPCHGSRFALDGTVLQGPATEPLGPAETAEDAPHGGRM